MHRTLALTLGLALAGPVLSGRVQGTMSRVRPCSNQESSRSRPVFGSGHSRVTG